MSLGDERLASHGEGDVYPTAACRAALRALSCARRRRTAAPTGSRAPQKAKKLTRLFLVSVLVMSLAPLVNTVMVDEAASG
jgi:hypothetical protein